MKKETVKNITIVHYGEDYATLKVNDSYFEINLKLAHELKKAKVQFINDL
jgi:hypothetical protein